MARFTKVVFAAALVCALCLPAVAAQSATDLTGKHWLQSSQNEKLAFLYGASNIIAIEQLIAQQQGTQASPFVTAWIKATLGITGLSLPRVHIDGVVWHLDVGSSHPGAVVGPKGWAVRPLKRYASWVQNVVRQFGPYPARAEDI